MIQVLSLSLRDLKVYKFIKHDLLTHGHPLNQHENKHKKIFFSNNSEKVFFVCFCVGCVHD
jgi:hypothetical protein